MGLFKDFATSGYGDFTVGALQGLSEAGQRDAAKNERFATDALNKENESMKLTELAYKNKQQINNIIAENIFEFGFTEGSLIDSRLNKNQAADRLTNKIFNEQRSIFESKNFDKVKGDVARYLSRPGNIGEGIMLDSPYIPSQNKFQVEKDKHAAKLSEISKTPRVDKLLMNIEEAEKGVPEPEAITDARLKVRGLSAKAYGILNTFPGTYEGDTNLKLNQTMIITANARDLYPNDKNARVNFINKKMYQNNIDPLESIKFTNNFTFGEISNFVSEKNAGLIGQLSENNNAMAQAQNNNERIAINDLNNQILFKIYENINQASKFATVKLAGRDRDMKPPVTVPEEITPPVKTPTPDVSEDIEKEGAEPEKAGEIGAFQAKFNFNVVDQNYLVDQWSKYYQGENNQEDKKRAIDDLRIGSNNMPQEAADEINQVANVFDKDKGFSKDQITEILSAIGFIESKYKTKIQGNNGPARSYWQIEPSTAKDILAENLKAMKDGKAQLLGPKFEALFKSKYADVIGNRTALEYFASLNKNQLQELLLRDGVFAASMAAHKVVSTFDPYGSREA